MFEWLSDQYLNLVANYQILLENPSQCSTVDILRMITIPLFVIFVIKLVVHLVVFYRMKKKFSRLSEGTNPDLFRVYRGAAQKAKIRRLPPLYQFSNERPLVFTIGSLKPAIFLAPSVAEKMPREELDAVLVHELTHIKRQDNFLFWLLEVLFVSIPILVIQLFALSFVFNVQNSLYAIAGALLVVTLVRAVLWKRILFLREVSCDDLSVDAIKDPLILASSLVNVWRLGRSVPRYRWHRGLAFAQTLLPAATNLDSRVRRLIKYRRPWLKFFLGKAVRFVAVFLAVFSAGFLWQFYSVHDHPHLQIARNGGAGVDYVCEASGIGDTSGLLLDEVSNRRFSTVISRYAELVNTQDFHGIHGLFVSEIVQDYSIEEVKNNHRLLLDYFGRIQSFDPPKIFGKNQAVIPVHFERGVLDMQLTLDGSDKIVGLALLPALATQYEEVAED